MLQKSIEVRAQPPESLRESLQPTPRMKVNTLDGEGKRQKGKSVPKNE
jgi:hypothetical protein